jgi:hypothetical protein
MDMSDVRGALETMLNGVDSIKSASGYPTENVGSTPFAFVGFDLDAVTSGQRELSIHTLPITVLVIRKGGNLVNQVKAVEAVIEELKAAIRANQSLGMPTFVSRVQYTRFEEGIFTFAGNEYVGFIATVDIKTYRAVSYAAA